MKTIVLEQRKLTKRKVLYSYDSDIVTVNVYVAKDKLDQPYPEKLTITIPGLGE